MNKIEFPRIGVDGKERSEETIICDYAREVVPIIQSNMQKVPSCNHLERFILKKIKDNIDSIILAPPEDLQSIVNTVKMKRLGGIFYVGKKGTQFGKDILDAFAYENFRVSTLQSLANNLDIKCCPYCNQHYTLYVISKDKRKGGTRFHFDHFYSKSRYPFLSMSFYNLIPSCPVCNQRKSEKDLPIQFNPYYGEIASYFNFETRNHLSLLLRRKGDFEIGKYWRNLIPDVKLIDNNGRKAFDEMTDLEKQYSRHKDIVEEIYARAYLERYYHYSSNFKKLSGFSQSFRQRVMHGTYMDPKDIDKRPLTKLYQDLWTQARGIVGIE